MNYKYVLGSALLHLNNSRDVDEITFIDKPSWEVREQGCRSIPFIKKLIKSFIEGKNKPTDHFKSLSIYQQSAPFFEDKSYPFNDFNILDHKAVWIDQLKRYANDSSVEEKAIAGEVLPKNFYHLLYQYYMIVENTHWISDESKDMVQKIHDLEMPSSYFYELRDLINTLEGGTI